ncbi:MAG: histidinol-phosphate transaminase [Planctomycetaceae bacterium]
MNPVRPDIQRIAGYVPGEQPQDAGWIKLNTNENPYPPSPRVVEAIRDAARGRLNVYPDPLATRFRNAAAERFRIDPDGVLPANGSDENLTILMRTFVDAGERVALPYPSYILYETLADIQGAKHERLPLNRDWSFDFEAADPLVARSKLVFVPNPNSPSGNRWSHEEVLRLVPPDGVLVLDEAYGDFADEPHRGEILRSESGRQIVITRTLSKSCSLAGVRFGFAIADPALVAEMRKVKDSYNCNALSLAAATAALEDWDWVRTNADRIRRTRSRLTEALQALGFAVVPSQANFVWTRHTDGHHEDLYRALKSRKVLVRYMRFPEARSKDGNGIDGLRITIGTDAEVDAFLDHLRELV